MRRTFFESIGSGTLNMLEGAGGTILLLGRSFYWSKASFHYRKQILHQMDLAGVGSIPVVSLVAVFTGMVISFHTGMELFRYHTEEIVGSLVAISMFREMGPVITAVMVVGRVGAAMAAEIGTMKVSEEIDALQTMSINPIRYLAMPRIIALFSMLPILTIFAIVVGILGGAVIANNVLKVDYQVFLSNALDFLRYKDILSAMVKSVVFAIIIGAVSCYQGMNARGGAEGVGKATIRAVVLSFVFIMIFTCFLMRLFY